MPDKLSATIAVLGGGPAGYVAAIRASQLGADVVLIEKDELGGVCLNRGCIPTKALLKTSESAYLIGKGKEFGISCALSNIDWNVANERKNRVVKNLNMGLGHMMSSRKIRVIKGTGRVKNPKKITVSTPEGEKEVACNKMIIATGSEPFLPPIKGITSDGVITSNEALQLTKVPESIVIIGAGVIGVEFATMFNFAGARVTVLEMQDRILPQEDSEVAAELMKIMKRQGITIKLSSMVNEIKQKENGLEISYNEKDMKKTLQCENVLVAVGRKLNSDADYLKTLSLDIKNGAIEVNEKMETSVKGVYAAGDVIGGHLLAHLAFAEGKVAAENALGLNTTVNYNAVPACIYTSPEIASVGFNEEAAKNHGIDIKVGRFSFRHNGRALSLGEREGFVKIVIDSATNVIIGGQILGPNASEMISEITLAITLKATANILADMIHPHPTLSEAVWEACSDAIGRSIHKV